MIVFVIAFIKVGQVAWLFVPERYRIGAIPSFVALAIVGSIMVLSLWVAFRFWRIAAGSPAGGLFKVALIGVVAVPIGLLVIDNIWLLIQPGHFGTWWDGVVTVIPIFIFFAALLRSRWAPDWVSWTAIVSTSLTLVLQVAEPSRFGFLPAFTPLYLGWLQTLLTVIAEVGLGVALLARAKSTGPLEEIEPVGRAEQALQPDASGSVR